MAAILQSAGILANNAAQYQNANARIFDAITNAANAYEEGQRRRAAALEAERKRQADQQAAQQAIALDPEKVTMQVLTKFQTDPASVTPQERAMFDAAQKTLGAKMAADQYGRAYRPYSPISLGGTPADVMAPMPIVQEQELPAPTASPMGAMMDMPLMPNVSGGLLPPPAALKEGETRMDMTVPAPIGQAETKVSAISQVRPVKMIAGAAGPIPDPVDLKRYEAELAAAKETDVGSAKSEADKKKQRFNDSKMFQTFAADITNLNSKIDEAVKKSNFLNTRGLAGEGGRGFLGSGNFTGGVDLAETLKTIEADSALGRLMEMKEQSSTGASGLGALSEKELGLLTSARQSVAQSQTEEQLDKNLREYKKIRTQVLKNVAEGYKQQYGEYPQGFDPKQFIDASSIPQGAIDKLKANPQLRGAFEAKYGKGSASKVLGE
jgi:hypothetical protein